MSLATVAIRPEVTMLSVLRHLNYKPWYALAEFIDNSLQSYLYNRVALQALHGPDFHLRVEIRVDANAPGQITVTDNAAGIALANFPRAFRPAHVPLDRSGLSEFGMGMKSAACWFAETWSVRTKALGEDDERTVRFDVRQIVDNRMESVAVTARASTPNAHYTVVSLQGLHHLPQARTVGKMKDHLASIYRVFLRERQMTLVFNGEELKYERPDVLSTVRYSSPGVPSDGPVVDWSKEIHLDFGDGFKVTGFAALREVGSTHLAGFALFRRGRLIEGSHDETYRPTGIFKQTNSYPYQRLFGELEIHGFEVSHTKDGFRWEEHEDLFLDCLREAIEEEPLNLLAQAENYRALPSKKSIESRATAATEAVAKHLSEVVAPVLARVQAEPPEAPPLPETLAPSSAQASERTVTIEDGSWNWVITLRTSVDRAREDWVSLAKQDSLPGDPEHVRRLCIDLSLAHPFSAKFLGANNENVELFLRVATAISISLVLTEDFTGDAPESVLFHFNNLLRGALYRSQMVAS